MNKVMISVAPVDAADTSYDARAIADDVIECYKLGASMVHLHVRDEHGRLTPDMSLLQETVEYIKEACDIVIEISTGGVSDLTIEERCQPCYASYVEATSLNVGSVNLGEAVYQNPINDVEYCVDKILKNNKRPEIEVFELGMVNTVKELDKKFNFTKPICFALVFGHGGEMPATKEAFHHMKSYLYELFDEDDVRWGYTQAHRKDWDMMGYALDNGAHSLRVGFEDSHHLSWNKVAKTNAEIVKAAVDLVKEKDMEPMTPAEVREMFKI